MEMKDGGEERETALCLFRKIEVLRLLRLFSYNFKDFTNRARWSGFKNQKSQNQWKD